MSLTDKIRLFGEQFSRVIDTQESFVVMFIVGFPSSLRDAIISRDFTVRDVNQTVCHSCYVKPTEQFWMDDLAIWASKAVTLLNLYAELVPG